MLLLLRTIPNSMQLLIILIQLLILIPIPIGFLLIFGRLSTAFWTNLISSQIFYFVFIGKSFEIRKYYNFFFTICIGVPLLFAIIAVAEGFVYNSKNATASCFLIEMTSHTIYDDTASDDEIALRRRYDITNAYDIFHIMSLSFNVVTSVGVFLNVSLCGHVKSLNLLNSQRNLSLFSLSSITSMISGNTSRRQLAIKTLALRLILYPMVQIANEAFRIADQATSSRYSSIVVMNSLVSGLLGTFYFLIFMFMQPNAKALLINDIKRLCFNNVKDEDRLTAPLHSINTLRVTWVDNHSISQTSHTEIKDMDEDQLVIEIDIDEFDDMSSRNSSSVSALTDGPMSLALPRESELMRR